MSLYLINEKVLIMFLHQDYISSDIENLIEQIKITRIVCKNPEFINQPQKIKKELNYHSSLFYPFTKGIMVKLIDCRDTSEYWNRMLGVNFYLTDNSYSMGGVGLIDTTGGNYCLNDDHKHLIFEIIALPLVAKKLLSV